MRSLLVLLAVGLVAGDLAEDKLKYLLPGDLIPESYELAIATNIDNFNALNESSFYFYGSVTINVTAQKNVKDIILHTYDDMVITGIAVTGDGDFTAQDAGYDTETNKQTISVSPALLKGTTYSVHLNYTGRNTNELTGFYRSSYIYQFRRRWLLVTDFEPFGARRAFPCFDEPQYKATFKLTSLVKESLIEKAYSTKFNTEVESEETIGEWHATTFKRTPYPISTYLVAFLVSDFIQSPEPAYFESGYAQENPTKPFYTVGQPKFFEPRQDLVSQVAGPASLEFVTKKTNVGYAFDKVDQAGIPDFAAGAMENWGLVTYRENLLFWDESSGTEGDKQLVVQVTAHELGHQWFGDLVTLHWWSDLWLNEGFATFFETHAADQIREPTLDTSSWDLVGQFVTNVVQKSAFFNDGYNDTRALTAEAYDRETIGDYFDSISYEKGGSVLRMWMHILGEDLFYAGLSTYLNKQAEKTGTPEILLSSFDEAISAMPLHQQRDLPIPAAEFFAVWHLEGGYPVVNVARNGAKLTFTQERFLFWGESDTLYNIPLTYSSDVENNFNNTLPDAYLLANQGSSSIQLQDTSAKWIVINNQATGYYRVNYDDDNWDTLLEIINDPDALDQIHPYNRAQIFDDSLNLGRAMAKDYRPYKYILSLLRGLRHERNLNVWRSALTGMNQLLTNLESQPITHALLKIYLAWVVEPAFKELSLTVKPTDSHTQRLLRADVAEMACKLDLPACRKQAKELFESNTFKPDVRRTVMCDSVRHGDADIMEATLYRAFLAEGSVRADFMAALTCTRDTAALYRLLESTNEDKRFTEVDAMNIASAAATESAASAEITLQYAVKKTWISRLKRNSLLNNLARSIVSDEAADAVRAMSPFAANAIEINGQWLHTKNEAIQEWLQLEVTKLQ